VNLMLRAALSISGVLAMAGLPLVAAEVNPESLRTWEIVRRDCRNSISRQEVTLFGNGTLRLKLRYEDKDEMHLAEMPPEDVEAFIRRLEAEDLSEVPENRDEVLGTFVERCGLFLDLPGRQRQQFFFARFDSLPLGLSRLNAIVEDLLSQAEALAPEGGLPPHYLPEPGDTLLRTDGQKFRVVALTSDKRGVELAGVDQPLTIFVALEDLRDQFNALLERRKFP
jgi:hypothetical protein